MSVWVPIVLFAIVGVLVIGGVLTVKNNAKSNMDKELQRSTIGMSSQNSTISKPQKYLKQSVYKQILANAIKNHSDPDVIDAILQGIREDLEEKNISVVSDEDFYRLTGTH